VYNQKSNIFGGKIKDFDVKNKMFGLKSKYVHLKNCSKKQTFLV